MVGPAGKAPFIQLTLILVFLVSGLWHGANWTFVVWGGLHGFIQIVAKISGELRHRLREKAAIKTDCFSWRLLQICLTFCFVTFAWIFFRADTITDALRFIKRILVKPTPWLLFNGGVYNLGLNRVEMNILVCAIVILFLVDLVRYLKKQTIDAFLQEQNIWFEWLVVILLVVMIFIFGQYGPTFDAQQFIYFQF